ncbi:unnamed protein product, partial [marine sediment metagenome]
PKFLLENFKPMWYGTMGEENNHIKMTKSDPEGCYFNIMKFNTRDDITIYEKASKLNIVGAIGVNRYYSEEKKKLYTNKQMMADVIVCN